MECDLLLADGIVLDGTGCEGFAGSVAVTAARIVAVGDVRDMEATTVIDCRGKVISPGFIDMHSHADWVVPQAEHGAVLAPLLEQGITTVVGGNCGCSPAPYGGANRDLLPLIGLMLHDRSLDYGWTGVGSYLTALEERGLALNVALLAGHGTIRAAVMGFSPGKANPEQTAAMADLVRAALDEGAVGLSTGLGYAPGIFAATDELLGVTAPLRERGGIYTSHARSFVALNLSGATGEAPANILALDETAAIAKAYGVPVQHSHLIFVGDATWPTTDLALERLDELSRAGVDIACDAFPYVGGNTTLIVFMPAWSLTNLHEAVTNPAKRESIAATARWALPSLGMQWDDVQILWVPEPRNAHYEGMTVGDIARERGADATETYLDLVGELGPQTRIMNWNYSGRGEEETSLRKVLQFPLTCFETDTILTGNGMDNPASYGTFPRLLGHYARDLRLFSLPDAVHRMTGFSAARMGLKDRGRVAPGLAADLVVFDPATVADNTTRQAPNRRPAGIETVVLNGRVVVKDGVYDRRTKAGRVLKRR